MEPAAIPVCRVVPAVPGLHDLTEPAPSCKNSLNLHDLNCGSCHHQPTYTQLVRIRYRQTAPQIPHPETLFTQTANVTPATSTPPTHASNISQQHLARNITTATSARNITPATSTPPTHASNIRPPTSRPQYHAPQHQSNNINPTNITPANITEPKCTSPPKEHSPEEHRPRRTLLRKNVAPKERSPERT